MLIYLAYMASSGRPPERPVHLSAEDRRVAQLQTAQWRHQTDLSQAEMAKELLVSSATYRQWENSKDSHAGPTGPQAAQLDRVLQRRLPGRYTAGDALRVWGWAASGDMSYERLAGLLRSTGFEVPNSHTVGPSIVLWVHRLQRPNLVHAVFALAAAAATRAGLSVRLLLDDTTLTAWERTSYRDELESAIRAWFRFAAGHEARLSTDIYSEILTPELLAERGWRTASDYLNRGTEVLKFLLAAKVVSPAHYSIGSEESVLAILRQSESVRADRLLTALKNWMVFEREIANLLEPLALDAPTPIVTLGGEDERPLWELWHSACSGSLTSRVQHIYLSPMPMPIYRAVWHEPALEAGAPRSTLAEYLRRRTLDDGNSDLLEWIIKAAINLPAVLSEEYLGSLDPVALDPGTLLGRPTADAAATVARAVIDWLHV
jgi:transcriptional regulator with XRE-family HTH domain